MKDDTASGSFARVHLPTLPENTLVNGRYQILQLVHQNEFSALYQVSDQEDNAFFWLEELLPTALVSREGLCIRVLPGQEQNYRELLAKFREHNDLLRKLQLPGLPRYKARFSTAEGEYALIEAEAIATTLQERLQQTLSAEAAWALFRPFAAIIISLHKQHLCHHDLYLENFALSKDNQALLLHTSELRMQFSKAQGFVSEVAHTNYAAIEMLSPQGVADALTDQYAFAACFYRFLTKIRPPVAGSRLVNDRLIAPSKATETLPAALDAVLLKALSVEKKVRFPSMEDFVFALDQCLLPEKSATTDKKSAAQNFVVLGLVAVVLLLGGLGAFLLTSPPTVAPSPTQVSTPAAIPAAIPLETKILNQVKVNPPQSVNDWQVLENQLMAEGIRQEASQPILQAALPGLISNSNLLIGNNAFSEAEQLLDYAQSRIERYSLNNASYLQARARLATARADALKKQRFDQLQAQFKSLWPAKTVAEEEQVRDILLTINRDFPEESQNVDSFGHPWSNPI